MKLIIRDYEVHIDDEDFKYTLNGLYVTKSSITGYNQVLIVVPLVGVTGFARTIMSAAADLCVDHIDGNSLNNQKANLRLVTISQNARNRETCAVSGVKGVTKNGSGYMANIWIDGKQKYLGTYPIKSVAEQVYKQAAARYFGEYALHLSRPQT
jgi:HNH endonuclease